MRKVVPKFEILCGFLSVLGASAVNLSKFFHRRDAEAAEITQRKAEIRKAQKVAKPGKGDGPLLRAKRPAP